MQIINLRLKSIIQLLQTIPSMHPNYISTPKQDKANLSEQSRAPSIFSKRLHFSNQNNNPFNKNRPVSASKILPGSSEIDLLKWLPLIKMVRKIQSKVKAYQMFLWCRLENFTQIKLQKKNSNKQNQLQFVNLLGQTTQQILNSNSGLKPSLSHSILNQEPENQSTSKIMEIQQAKIQDIKNNKYENNKQICEQKIQHKIMRKDHFLSQLIDIVQKTLQSIEQRRLRQSHNQILIYGSKKLSLQKFIKIELNIHIRKQLFNVMRMIKKHSHQVMKGQIMGNTLKNCIQKSKISVLHQLVSKLKIAKEASTKQSLKKQKLNNRLDSQKEIVKQVVLQSLETEEPTPKPILTSKNSSLNSLKQQKHQNLPKIKQTEFQMNLYSIQPLNLKLLKQTCLGLIFKEDKTVQKIFKNQNQHERLKKLSRLHPEEPFFQIPDISQITLFNPAINSNSSLFQFTSSKSTHSKFISTLDTHSISQQQTARSKIASHNFLDISPRLKEKSIETDPNKETASNKTKPSGKIIFLKQSSSINLKSNPQTPSSTKRIVGVFSKKRSIEIFNKNSISKNYDSKLSSCKSSIIKKSNNFVQIKPEKTQEQSKKKITQMQSKQNIKDSSSANYRKAHKQNIESKGISKIQTKDENIQKKISKSSKIVEKFLDLSAKRMDTIKKGTNTAENKENQTLKSFDKSSSRKGLYKNQSIKENQLREFNTLGRKVISYQEFIKQYPDQRQGSSGRKPLMQISENEPIFQQIQIEHDCGQKNSEVLYQSCSAQLPRERGEVGEAKCKKLRAKIDKIETNTALRMKLEIENMINQRKKSSIGILKY